MGNNPEVEKEKEALSTLVTVEDLVEKKAKIHSRLLMDAALAKDMEELALRNEKRKEGLLGLVLGKTPKEKKGQGTSASSGEEDEE